MRLVSVIVPVVERADDLLALYRAFAGELDRRGEEHEFLFVFDGGFAPPPELVALSQANAIGAAALASPATFGETAALRLGHRAEPGRPDRSPCRPTSRCRPKGSARCSTRCTDGADMVVANRSPRVDSWLNRLQSRGVPPDDRRA